VQRLHCFSHAHTHTRTFVRACFTPFELCAFSRVVHCFISAAYCIIIPRPYFIEFRQSFYQSFACLRPMQTTERSRRSCRRPWTPGVCVPLSNLDTHSLSPVFLLCVALFSVCMPPFRVCMPFSPVCACHSPQCVHAILPSVCMPLSPVCACHSPHCVHATLPSVCMQ